VQNGFPCGDHNQQGKGIPHLRPFNVTIEGQIELETLKCIETDKDVRPYLLKPGDIIFNNTNSEELVGKTAYWDRTGDFVLSNHMTILRVLDPEVLDPFYLSCFLHKRWYDGYYRGICRRHVNQASISLARLGDIPIPLPPLPEQRHIAHVLSTIQQAIAAQDAIIAAARELKRSLMRHLFTYGPGAEPVPTKETEVGEIAEHWEVVKLGRVLHTTQYGLSLRADHTGTYPMLRMNNLADGRIDVSDLKYVDLDRHNFAKFSVHKGDVLFNRTNSYELVGKTAIFDLDGDFVFASYLIRIVPDLTRLLPEYLNYYLNWDHTQRRLSGPFHKYLSG
jgi:type I restriction enzyme S subunit